MAAQDVADGLVRDIMARVRQRAHDAVVTSSRVLARQANHQCFHLGFHTGSARIGAVFGTIELAGDPHPIPRHDGVRFGSAGHLLQSFGSEPFSDLRQCTSPRIGRRSLDCR
jgi:hypothetical protein